MAFMDEDFLLNTQTARRLYHGHAALMPIIDYHCHIPPEDIAKDRRYANITQLWLEGDHYKWRLMRANGADESAVTGPADPYTRFEAFAAALAKAAGNPVYHWAHLELRRYFGIETPLCPASAKGIYDACNRALERPAMGAQGLIRQSNVRLICTTDDPADSLEHHEQIARDPGFPVKVLPTFRPDKALAVDAPGFGAYAQTLAAASGVEVVGFGALCAALANRAAFFERMGCRAADHGLERMVFAPAAEGELDAIVRAALGGSPAGPQEADKLRTALLLYLGRLYSQKGWVMQLHFGCLRNTNSNMLAALGPDTGFDAMNDDTAPARLAPFMDALDREGQLPKMVLYSLNPADGPVIASIAGGFMANAGCAGKIQLGAPWWFNDTKSGMERQLQEFANAAPLGNFVGMLTDSRSLLSYTRHEYFRRILCNFIGSLVENGEYPAHFEALATLVEDICYHNTRRLFGFDAALGTSTEGA